MLQECDTLTTTLAATAAYASSKELKEVADILREEHRAVSLYSDSDRRPTTIFFGETQTGKSTLIQELCGAPLVEQGSGKATTMCPLEIGAEAGRQDWEAVIHWRQNSSRVVYEYIDEWIMRLESTAGFRADEPEDLVEYGKEPEFKSEFLKALYSECMLFGYLIQ